jgi:hypothetical protein
MIRFSITACCYQMHQTGNEKIIARQQEGEAIALF